MASFASRVGVQQSGAQTRKRVLGVGTQIQGELSRKDIVGDVASGAGECNAIRPHSPRFRFLLGRPLLAPLKHAIVSLRIDWRVDLHIV
jgi:hypothetical protein